MHSQKPPGVVQNWSTLQCSKQNTEQCGYDHAPVTRGRMRAQFPLPHGLGAYGQTVSWGVVGVKNRGVAPPGACCIFLCLQKRHFWASAPASAPYVIPVS